MADLLHDVHDWIQGLASEMVLAAGTLTKYEQVGLAHATASLARGACSWGDVTPDNVRADMAANAASRPTARVRLTAMRCLYRWLREHELASNDPTATVRSPRIPGRVLDVLAEAEVGAMLDSCRGGSPYDLRDLALLEVAYSTGARSAELSDLLLPDLDLARGSVLLRGKGARPRFAALGESARNSVRTYLERGRAQLDGDPAEAHVFLSRERCRLSAMGLWGIVKRRAAAAGIERRVHPHMLRHACAVHMLKRGADPRTLQMLLGHANLATVQVYLQLDDRWLREAHRRYHPRG